MAPGWCLPNSSRALKPDFALDGDNVYRGRRKHSLGGESGGCGGGGEGDAKNAPVHVMWNGSTAWPSAVKVNVSDRDGVCNAKVDMPEAVPRKEACDASTTLTLRA